MDVAKFTNLRMSVIFSAAVTCESIRKQTVNNLLRYSRPAEEDLIHM